MNSRDWTTKPKVMLFLHVYITAMWWPPSQSQTHFNIQDFKRTTSKVQPSYTPLDWLRLHQRSVRHDFHPRLHLFVRVCAEIVRPHVGMCGLDEKRGQGQMLTWRREKRGGGRLERYQLRQWCVWDAPLNQGCKCVEWDLLRTLPGDRHIAAPLACTEHTSALLQPDSQKRKAAC